MGNPAEDSVEVPTDADHIFQLRGFDLDFEAAVDEEPDYELEAEVEEGAEFDYDSETDSAEPEPSDGGPAAESAENG